MLGSVVSEARVAVVWVTGISKPFPSDDHLRFSTLTVIEISADPRQVTQWHRLVLVIDEPRVPPHFCPESCPCAGSRGGDSVCLLQPRSAAIVMPHPKPYQGCTTYN